MVQESVSRGAPLPSDYGRASAFLELEKEYGDGEEDDDPDEGGDEALVDGRLGHTPAACEHRAEGLRALRQRQQEADIPQDWVHPLDRPNDAAQHDDRKERAHCHVRRATLVVARARHHEACDTAIRDTFTFWFFWNFLFFSFVFVNSLNKSVSLDVMLNSSLSIFFLFFLI